MAKDFVVSAQNAWFKKTGESTSSDRPSVTVWMPRSVPTGYLQTLNNGCQNVDTLPPGPPIGKLNLGGVQFGGYLDELELFIDAAREVVDNLRVQYDNMVEAADVKSETNS